MRSDLGKVQFAINCIFTIWFVSMEFQQCRHIVLCSKCRGRLEATAQTMHDLCVFNERIRSTAYNKTRNGAARRLYDACNEIFTSPSLMESNSCCWTTAITFRNRYYWWVHLWAYLQVVISLRPILAITFMPLCESTWIMIMLLTNLHITIDYQGGVRLTWIEYSE